MKILLLILILPVFSFGQTIHIKEKKVVYEGIIKTNLPSSEKIKRVQAVLPGIVDGYKLEGLSQNSIAATGQLNLKTPHPIIRTVVYSIKITSTEKGYEYVIDSVFFFEQERGRKPIVKSSKEMVDNMGETGKIVGDTEKILNETDMRFQELLDRLKYQVKQNS